MPERKNDSKLMAKVYDRSLYYDQVEESIPPDISEGDSINAQNVYVERWVREQLLLHEATEHSSKGLDIEKLVDDYRASLLMHNYEKYLVDISLDSLVSQDELQTYYEENKSQYKLVSPIIKCTLIKLPLETEGLKTAMDWWESGKDIDEESLMEYAEANASIILNNSSWTSLNEISVLIPDWNSNQSKFKKGERVLITDDESKYFIRFEDKIESDNTAPIEYIKDQLIKVILHKRKKSLLSNQREELYYKALERNIIKIYK